ncbi:MAG: ATP-binding protein [Desulfotalea sp.]
MIIQFTIKNHKSIKEEQVFSMVAIKPKQQNKVHENNFFAPLAPKPLKLARTAAIFGRNAAGKSNLIDAFEFMKHIVLNSNRFQPGEQISCYPFLFDDFSWVTDSEYEIEFIAQGIRYQFGFTCHDGIITEEWLLAWPKGSQQLWYERFFDDNDQEDYKFGTNFKGSKTLWKDSTGPSTLFLSRAAEHNSEQLKPVFDWFKKLIILGHRSEFSPGMTADFCKSEENKNKTLDFFKKLDLPIHNVTTKEEKIDEKTQKELQTLIGKFSNNQQQASLPSIPTKLKKIAITHFNPKNGKEYSLNLDEESEGTKKLFSYAKPIIEAMQDGLVFIIDEMSNSLHANLSKAIIQIFNSPKNYANSQLIFSTHDTSMLSTKLLRRDQIWFIDKNDEEASYLTPLTDYKPRSEEALEKNYLAGKYGSVPYVIED